MKYLKQAVLLVLIFFGLIGISKYVYADAAPNPPDCAGGASVSDGAGGYKPIPITCGVLYLNFYIDLGQYKDKFILLNKKEYFGGDLKYSVITYGVASVSLRGKVTNTYFTVDKDYFNSKGGLSGIFSNVTHIGGEFGNYITMDPKNSAEFSAHSHNFFISVNDDLLLRYLNPTMTDEKNIQFPNSGNIYPYGETAHLECNGTNTKCTEDITYVPESFSGKDIILTVGKIVYTPNTIGQSITYPIYNQKGSAISNQNQGPSTWFRFWNWIKSIF